MSFKISTSQRLGKIQSIKTAEDHLIGETSFGKFKITIYSPYVIRVAITRDETFEDFSYAIVANAESNKINVLLYYVL